MLKKILRNDRVRSLFSWLGSLYIRLVWYTGSWTIDNDEQPKRMWAENKPFIMAFWHGHLLMMPYAWRTGRVMYMLISRHRDGQLIAKTISYLGLHSIAGSSGKSGASAVRQILKVLKTGSSIGMTPDGPRGPRMRASRGIIDIARLSGVPIIPCAFSCKKRRILGSWDKFRLALPFSKGIIAWGDPVTIAPDLDPDQVEQEREKLETAMIALAANADARMGHEPPPPANLGETSKTRRSA